MDISDDWLKLKSLRTDTPQYKNFIQAILVIF